MTYESRNALRRKVSDEPLNLANTAAAQEHFLGVAEWAIIDMAGANGPPGSKLKHALMRAARKLVGIPPERPLADRRFEVLRRFAAAAWFRDEIPTRHMRALFSVGFSSNDAARIIAHVAAIRGFTPDVEAWP